MFSGSAVIGFGQGFLPVCGFNYGAKLYDRVRKGYWFCMKVGVAVLTVIAVTIFAFAPQVVLLFQKNDPQVVELGARALRYQIAVLPLVSYIMVNNMTLQTVGEAGLGAVHVQTGAVFYPLYPHSAQVPGLTGGHAGPAPFRRLYLPGGHPSGGELSAEDAADGAGRTERER